MQRSLLRAMDCWGVPAGADLEAAGIEAIALYVPFLGDGGKSPTRANLVVRDGHCRHQGCDRPPPWCDAHHVVYTSDGGPTSLDNLVLACTRHHHLWHDSGWKLSLAKDATLTLVSPAGLLLESRPSRARLGLTAPWAERQTSGVLASSGAFA